MSARRNCRRPASSLPALARSAEAVVIPLLAILAAAVLFSIFLIILGKSPVEFFTLLWVGGFGTPFSWTNTLVRAGPLIFTALCVAIPARLGMVVIGGEGALVLGGFAAAAIAIPLIDWASPWITMPAMILAAVAGRRGVDRLRRRAPPLSRRQRDHLQPAPLLHRRRDHELLRRGRAPRPEQPQQAVDPGDRRRRTWSARSPAPTSTGASPSAVVLAVAPLGADEPHQVRLRGADHRRQCARGAGAGPAGRQAHRHLLRHRRSLRRPRRLFRGRRDPGPRQCLARRRLRLHRHPRRLPRAPEPARHHPGRDLPRRHRRRRRPRSSAAWTCPTQPCRCCRG